MRAVAAKQDRGVGRNRIAAFAAKQPMDRLAEMLSLEIPQGHVDGGHRGDRHRRAAEIDRPGEHLLPQPLGLERVLADQQLAQSAGDVVTERGIDDRLDDFGRGIGLADPFRAVVGADPHEDRVLTACRLGGDLSDPQDLADHMRDFHCFPHVCLRNASLGRERTSSDHSASVPDFTPNHSSAPSTGMAPATPRLARQPTDSP